ncbi:hypothetical protein J6590_005857 [Homalodisca vitripennis]|nr:hypothetical protein J6590_005857 [Homalodisca vitripennis]
MDPQYSVCQTSVAAGRTRPQAVKIGWRHIVNTWLAIRQLMCQISHGSVYRTGTARVSIADVRHSPQVHNDTFSTGVGDSIESRRSGF